MNLDIDTIFIIIQIGIIPAIISFYKIITKEYIFKLFYYYNITCYLTEIVTNRLLKIKLYNLSNSIVNTFMIIEAILLIKIILQLSDRLSKIKVINIFISSIWIIENFWIHNIFDSEKYFNVISAITIFSIILYVLPLHLNKNYSTFLKEPNILIILGILFNIIFRVAFEFIYYNYENNINIMKSIILINVIINAITSAIFIYCLLCIKNKKKLISSF